MRAMTPAEQAQRDTDVAAFSAQPPPTPPTPTLDERIAAAVSAGVAAAVPTADSAAVHTAALDSLDSLTLDDDPLTTTNGTMTA